jgi:hypothetical protein
MIFLRGGDDLPARRAWERLWCRKISRVSVEVGYRAPTPLGVRLAVSARLDRVDGRKLFVSGQVAVAGVVTAQANAVFVKLTRASVASIFPRHGCPGPESAKTRDRFQTRRGLRRNYMMWKC